MTLLIGLSENVLNQLLTSSLEELLGPASGTKDMVEFINSVLESSFDFYFVLIQKGDLFVFGGSSLWLELDEDLLGIESTLSLL